MTRPREIKIRAIDCENLGIQVVFVNHPSDYKEAKNNAHLIDAAPSLLKSCEDSLFVINSIIEGKSWGALEEYADDIRKAINKAKGTE